eukprot:TRINITY_DN40856_c0_g1_i1.p1 TRINITY_DN40856_c0_g1~~TRINITY_DN40856_c0_g1_i1.p1  ORF type:complete len:180 (+),score=50.18 TRINITY_DN40856_c0_g1_i1:276-815(+)
MFGRKQQPQRSAKAAAFTRRQSVAIQSKMGHAEIAEFREVFNLFDSNGDHTIDVSELGVAMRSLGQNPTEEELEVMVAEVDADASGGIDFQEFLALLSRQLFDEDVDKQTREVFDYFDTNKDGEISAEELKTTIFKITGQRMQDEEADEIVFECTKQLDADAKIQMDEFIEFMCTHQST